MLQKTGRSVLAGGVVLAVSAVMGGCSSQPHLSSVQVSHMGKTQVVYIKPQDNIVVTDPFSTRMAHVGKFITLDYLFGGLGVIGYFAGNKFPGGMDQDMDRSRNFFSEQHWPDRIQAAEDQAVAASPALAAAPHQVLDADLSVPGMQKFTAQSSTDSVIFLIPEMQMASEGDHLRMVVRVVVVGNPHNRPCRECEFGSMMGADATPVIADTELDVSQALVAVDGGKTWEEQKQSGHHLHDLTEADFAKYWLTGDPRPLVTFMQAAFPDMQAMLTTYLGGQAPAPEPMPTLKMVVY